MEVPNRKYCVNVTGHYKVPIPKKNDAKKWTGKSEGMHEGCVIKWGRLENGYCHGEEYWTG